MAASVDGIVKAYRLKRAGTGYIGACPACGYKDAFSLAEGEDGKVLMHCHVGCAFEHVARAIGEPTCGRRTKTPRPLGKNASLTNARNDLVARLVGRSIPASGTSAARYLASRGISLAPPPDIRFLRQHRHAPSRRSFAVMLGLVRGQDLSKLVFLDESGVKTNVARQRGRARKGKRVVASIPHGHWKSLTFIAGLRADRIDAPSFSKWGFSTGP